MTGPVRAATALGESRKGRIGIAIPTEAAWRAWLLAERLGTWRGAAWAYRAALRVFPCVAHVPLLGPQSPYPPLFLCCAPYWRRKGRGGDAASTLWAAETPPPTRWPRHAPMPEGTMTTEAVLWADRCAAPTRMRAVSSNNAAGVAVRTRDLALSAMRTAAGVVAADPSWADTAPTFDQSRFGPIGNARAGIGDDIAAWCAGRHDILAGGGPWTYWADWVDRAMRGDLGQDDLHARIALIPHATWQAGPEAVAARIAELQAG